MNFWSWSSKVIFKIQSSKKICKFLNLIFKSDLQNTIFKKKSVNFWIWSSKVIFKIQSSKKSVNFWTWSSKVILKIQSSKKICKFLSLIFKSDLKNTIFKIFLKIVFWRSLLMIAFKVYSFSAPFLQFFSSIFTVFCCILESSEN